MGDTNSSGGGGAGGMGLGGLISSVYGTSLNAHTTKRENDKMRDYNFGMYERERADQLESWNMQNQRDDETWNRQNEYNMMLWNKQNAYDSPSAQMSRYKEAGLNPHLIYGQSNTGGAVATANLESGNLQGSPSAKAYNPRVPDYGGIFHSLSKGLMDMLAFKEKAAQIDNLKEQNNVLKEEAAQKAAGTSNILANTANLGISGQSMQLANAKSRFEVEHQSELYQSQMDAIRESTRRAKIEGDVALRNDERAALTNDMSLREGAERILNMRGQRMTQDIERQIKQIELSTKSEGPLGLELLNRYLGYILREGKEILVDSPPGLFYNPALIRAKKP